jgi:hypothetical protein
MCAKDMVITLSIQICGYTSLTLVVNIHRRNASSLKQTAIDVMCFHDPVYFTKSYDLPRRQASLFCLLKRGFRLTS